MFLQELGQHSNQAGRTPRIYINHDTSDWQLHNDLNSNRTDLFSFNRSPELAKQLDEQFQWLLLLDSNQLSLGQSQVHFQLCEGAFSTYVKIKMHAIARLYWIRTNVSSIAASALTTKLNARKVDTIMLFAVMHL